MNGTENARDAVFAALRKALGVQPNDAARLDAVADRLRRHPRGTIPGSARQGGRELLALFATMLQRHGAKVTRVETGAEVLRVIAGDLRTNQLPPCLRIGSDSELAALPWDSAPGLERRSGPVQPDDRAALSRAAVAAAETGTLFLVSGPGNPSLANFLPETHFVVLRAEDVVGSYEEAFDRLRGDWADGGLPATVNLISGPSRTADIEQTLVRGAHGPKRLHVVLFDQAG